MNLAPYRKIIWSVGLTLLALGVVASIAASYGGLPPLVRHQASTYAAIGSRAVQSSSELGRPITAHWGGVITDRGGSATFTTWLLLVAFVSVLVGIAWATAVADRSAVSRESPAEGCGEWPPSHYCAVDWQDKPEAA